MSLTNDQATAKNFQKFYEEIRPYLNGATHAGFTPVGTIISYFGETAPTHYLICDGATYNKVDYPELWTHLSSLTDTTPYIVDNDNTKFKVPDLRGEFLRGTGTNSHTNQGSGADVGVHQDGTEHTNHAQMFDTDGTAAYYSWGQSGVRKYYYNNNPDAEVGDTGRQIFWYSVGGSSNTSHKAYITSRPTNTSVLYCIAYKNIYIDAKFQYSLEEQVVGTWIDGKPLYQKTIDTTTNSNTSDKEIDDLTGKTLVNISGIIYGSNIYMINAWDGSARMLVYETSNNKLIAYAQSTWCQGKRLIVTIQYTKTTD